MKTSHKLFIFFSLSLSLLSISTQVYAKPQLGIHLSHPQEVEFTQNLEGAFDNTIAVRNYKDKTAMIRMLTRFNQLDAVLISKDTYQRHNSASLIPLTEVQISAAGTSDLVLATHSFTTKTRQEEILHGYQELLLSTNGLELLEFYATGRGKLPAQVETPVTEKAPARKDVAPAETKKSTKKTTELQTSPPVSAKPVQKPLNSVPAEVTKVTPTSQAAVAARGQSDADQEEAATRDKLWRPHIDITGKLGNDRSLGELELFIPLAQRHDQLFFLDLRFQLDDNEETEGNFGAGLRKIMNNSWILGGYAFYDLRESSYDNEFKQLTLGVEALTEEYDARANVYLAEDKDYLVAREESTDEIVFSGFNLIYQTGGPAIEIREKAMSGFDAELGWKLPWFDNPEIRSYIGGYHFSASGVEDITGPRGRITIRFPDIFGWSGSLFELGGELRHDDVRDTDYFISARGRIPFGAISPAPQKSQGLSARMTERVQRDPDIVVAKQRKDTSTPVKATVLTDGGDAINITHVDSQSIAGDGSFDSPFNTLSNAETSNNDIVLLYADSTFEGEGFTLKPNQRLLGGSLSHTINTDQFGIIPLPQFSTGKNLPTIQNYAGNAVTLASGSEVSGVHFTGVTTAIYGNSVGGVDINRNVITNVDDGIVLEALVPHTVTSSLRENIFSNTVWDGIYISNDNLADTVKVEISDNQIEDIGGAGIIFDNSGLDLNLFISGNSISGTMDEGLVGFNLPTGTTLSATLIENIIEDVGESYDGVGLVNTGDTINLYLQDNHVDGDVLNLFADFYIDNSAGTTFNLGATAGNSAIGSSALDTDKGVIAAEGNTRSDMTTAPNVDAFGIISIVDKSTMPGL